MILELITMVILLVLTHINPSSARVFTIKANVPRTLLGFLTLTHTNPSTARILTLRHPNPSSADRKSQVTRVTMLVAANTSFKKPINTSEQIKTMLATYYGYLTQ